MELPILHYTGQDTGRKAKLADEIFAIQPNDHAIYLDVKQILANKRQGTHKAKERGEVTGSTRKIKKQKGTGTARAGSIKSPIFRGGGCVFGPKPREYGFKLNKKLKKLARRSMLSYKAKEGNITVLEDFSFTLPKTKQFLGMLQSLNLEGQKTLLILPTSDKNIVLASRNISNASVLLVDQLNTHALCKASKILISETALTCLNQIFSLS